MRMCKYCVLYVCVNGMCVCEFCACVDVVQRDLQEGMLK